MTTIKECFKQIKQRPIIFIYTAIMMLGLCALEEFNPLTKKYGSFKVLLKQSYVDTLAKFAEDLKNWAATPGIMALNILVLVLMVLAFSAIMGIFGAGHGNTFYLSFLGDKRRGEFRQGINKHYVKIMFYIFFMIIFTALFMICVAYVAIPAIMTVKIVLEGDSGSIFVMLALCTLTVGIIYMATVFYIMTMSFIFPALVAYKRGGVTVAFRMVKGYCWYLIPRTTLFAVFLLAIQAGLLAVGYGLSSLSQSITVLAVNWVLKTVAVFAYLYFVFGAFTGMKEDMFPSYSN